MALIKVSTAYPERSSIQRRERFSPKKFRFVFYIVLHLVGIVSLVSCSWRTSGEGSGSPPAVYTRSASSILTDRAVLNGTVNSNGSAADAWFECGTDPALPTWTTTRLQAKQPVTAPLSFRDPIRGFSPYTTYYYRAVASNRFGTQKGEIQAFSTGEYYVALGDSITLAEGGRGYEPTLRDLLRNSKGFPNTVANWGTSGATAETGSSVIALTLSTVPWAKYFLVMFGTNDGFYPIPIPSGKGKRPGDPEYRGSYKDNMQKIISAILAAGKIPFLAKVPYTTSSSIDISSIREYNVVVDELVAENNISVTPPDFYAYFQKHQDEIPDGIHPNRIGYESMANLWFIALTQLKVPLSGTGVEEPIDTGRGMAR
jgi:lysophospholipase L1-like esterase